MPLRPREQTDVPTESRIRQVIRFFLQQEIRRLNNVNATVAADVAQNTSDISVNTAAISSNDADIDELQRRQFTL